MRERRDRQPPLYLITGIVLGLLAGLLAAYVILPVRYANTSPSTLSSAQKDIYRALVGRAYLYEADSGRAFSRLTLLQDVDPKAVLVAQSQQMLAANGDAEAAQGLGLLAVGQAITPLPGPTEAAEPATVTPTPTPDPPKAGTAETSATPAQAETKAATATVTPTQPTATPFATFTPRAQATPKPTQGAPYVKTDQKPVCDANAEGPLLMVEVYDSAGNGVPGVKVEISLPNGGSTDFYTGLYPEIDEGYADYTMNAGDTYSLRVGIGGDAVSGLTSPQCNAADGSTYAGSLQLTFKQP